MRIRRLIGFTRRRMQTRIMLSLCALSVLPCSPLDQIDAAHRAGFDAVGLRIIPGLETDIEVLSDRRLMADMRHRLSVTGVQVLDMDVLRLGPDLDVDGAERALAFGAEIGCRFLTITERLRTGAGPADDDEASVTSCARLCERSAPYGIRPIIEFMAFRRIGSLDEALRYVRRVGHPNLGLCVDVLHLWRSGGTPLALGRVDPDLVSVVHVSDGLIASPASRDLPYESRFARLDPGDGELPLTDFLRAVRPGTPIGVEVPSAGGPDTGPIARASRLAQKTRRLIASLNTRKSAQ